MTSYTFSMDILKQGVSYDFRVIAVNDYGYGTPSTPSPSVSGSQQGRHPGVPWGTLSPPCRGGESQCCSVLVAICCGLTAAGNSDRAIRSLLPLPVG